MEIANVRQRISKSGKTTYQAQIRIAGKPPIYKSFDDLAEARRFALIGQKKANAYLSPARPSSQEEATKKLLNEKLVDVMFLFGASAEIKQRHKNILPTIVANIRDVRIGEIRRSWVKGFIKEMRAKVSPRTHRVYTDQTIAALIQTMSVVVRWRADELDINQAPSCRLTVSGLPGQWVVKRDRRLAPSEEILLMRRLRQIDLKNQYHYRLMIRLALETGARMQELTLATWDEINMPQRFWTIPAEHTKLKIARVIPFTPKAFRILRVLQRLASPVDPRIFHTILPSSPTVSSCFHRYAKQAGVVGFRFHDLRHEAIARMVLYWRQYNLFELMTIAGHTDSKVFKRYANLRGADLAGRML